MIERPAPNGGTKEEVRDPDPVSRTNLVETLSVEGGRDRLVLGERRRLEVADGRAAHDQRDDRVGHLVAGVSLAPVAEVGRWPLGPPDVGAVDDVRRAVDHEAVRGALDRRLHGRIGGDAAMLILAVAPRR